VCHGVISYSLSLALPSVPTALTPLLFTGSRLLLSLKVLSIFFPSPPPDSKEPPPPSPLRFFFFLASSGLPRGLRHFSSPLCLLEIPAYLLLFSFSGERSSIFLFPEGSEVSRRRSNSRSLKMKCDFQPPPTVLLLLISPCAFFVDDDPDSLLLRPPNFVFCRFFDPGSRFPPF